MVSKWLVNGEKESSQVDFFSAQRQRNLDPSCVDEVPWGPCFEKSGRALAVNANKQNNFVQVVERWQMMTVYPELLDFTIPTEINGRSG
jgi:hypothetical protein